MKSLTNAASLALLFFAGRAAAWTNGSGTCIGESDAYWSGNPSTLGDVRILECSSSGFPGLPGATDADSSFAAAKSGILWAYWMWQKDNSTNMWLWVNQSSCFSGAETGGWYDNGNEQNDTWFESSTSSGGCDNSNALACEGTDHADCVPFVPGNNRILASDIKIHNDKPWHIVKQDTLSECFRNPLGPNSNSMQRAMLHEIGHSYGLDHNNAQISVMNVNMPHLNNCNFGANHADYPFPDEFQGYLQYHKSYSGTRHNLAGTPWISGGSLDSRSIQFCSTCTAACTTCLPSTITTTYTLNAYYNHTKPTYNVGYLLMRAAEQPTFASGTWTLPVSAKWLPFVTVVQNGAYYSRSQSISIQFLASDMPNGNTSYRLWVWVDPDNLVAETDESDNLFPTNIRVLRRLNLT